MIKRMALPGLQRKDKGRELIEREGRQHMPYLFTRQEVMMAVARFLR